MADETDDEVEAVKSGPRCGERLKAARTERSIDVATVARHLHVDAATVEALESNDFERLGAPVFARGHLRKYADYVGVPADEILNDYRSLQSSAELPPVVAPRAPGRVGFTPPPWLFGLLAAIVLLAVLLIWFLGGDEPDSPARSSAPPPATVATTDDELPPVVAGNDAVARSEPVADTDTAAESATASGSAAGPASAPADPSAVAGEEATLTLIYSGECWTEIRDGDGRRLYSGTGNVGDRRTLRGPLPFAVVLGNRAAVELLLNGEGYPVPSGRARLARFSIPEA